MKTTAMNAAGNIQKITLNRFCRNTLIDERLVMAAANILDLGDCLVSKSTRAGFTTSITIAAERADKRLLFVTPTVRIIKETLDRASDGRAIVVPANAFCPKYSDMIRRDRFLGKLPLPLDDCEKCKAYGHCEVTQILTAKETPVIALTSAKLLALMLSDSNTAEQIRQKLSEVDVAVIDEAHTIALPQLARVNVNHEAVIPEEFMSLRSCVRQWKAFIEAQGGEIDAIQVSGDEGHVGKHLSELVPIMEPIDFNILKLAWKELLDMARRRRSLDISEEDILALRDLISIIGGYWAEFSYLSEESQGNVFVGGNVGLIHLSLGDFLRKKVRRAKIICVSGTIIEPYHSFFDDLAGRNFKRVIFPDIRNTNSKMQIYPDTWRLTSHNFKTNLERIAGRIVEICKEHDGSGVYILCPNRKKAAILRKELEKIMGNKAPFVDHYRSDQTMGVERTERVCIAIGLAELPSNVCDHLARGKTPDERWLDSQALRIQNVQAATWQAWSRVKDPEGKRDSHVYVIGVRAHQVRDVVTWGTKRRVINDEIRTGSLPNGKPFKTAKFHVEVDELIEPPNIYSEDKQSRNLKDRSAGDYIAEIVKSQDAIKLKSSKCHDVLYHDMGECTENAYYIYSQNPYFLPEYVKAWHGSTDELALFLKMYFVHRMDCYAAQGWSDKSKMWGFFKTSKNITTELLKKHIEGVLDRRGQHFTMGVYQIDLDDTVDWLCFDVDNHDGSMSSEEVWSDIGKLEKVLDKYHIPHLVEASGSPDSYHIWVFLVPTRTYNAFKFGRQIAAEAGVKCEIFPKQKSINSDRASYGNLVKLPLCVHNKTGNRSGFIDPETREPFEYIPLPGLVRLFEQPESVALKVKTNPKGSSSGIQTNGRSDFRPCLRSLLESGESLKGSEGHEIRVALAIEAKCSGMAIDHAVDLFRNLPDFDEAITRHYLERIYKGSYNRLKCATILEKSGSIILPYCEKCALSWALDNVSQYKESLSGAIV